MADAAAPGVGSSWEVPPPHDPEPSSETPAPHDDAPIAEVPAPTLKDVATKIRKELGDVIRRQMKIDYGQDAPKAKIETEVTKRIDEYARGELGLPMRQQKESPRFSDLTMKGPTRKYRVQRLQEALALAHGDFNEDPSVTDTVQMLMSALTTAELQSLCDAVPPVPNERFWAQLGRHLCEQLLEASTRVRNFPGVAVAAVLRGLGVTSRADCKRHYGLDVKPADWFESDGIVFPKLELKKCNNGRLGLRQLETEEMHNLLQTNSTDTAKPISAIGRGHNVFAGRGCSKRPAADESDVKRPAAADESGLKRPAADESAGAPTNKRALTDSIRQIFLNNVSANSTVALSTFYRNMKDHRQFGKADRVLDMCEKCESWDRQSGPMARTQLCQWRQELEAIMPEYFDAWKRDILPAMDPHQRAVTVEFVTKFKMYVENHRRDYKKERAGIKPLKKQNALRKLEDKIRHELRTDWSRLDIKSGLLPFVESWSVHFTSRDNQNSQSESHLHNPEPFVDYFKIDFAQTRTLPVGPKEASGWFYANARQSMNILGFYLWGHSHEKPKYVTLLSDILNHDTAYVQAAFDRVFRMHPPSPGLRKMVLWGDVGRHFRSWRMLAYWLVEIAKRFCVPMEICFHVDGHGKGLLNGHFGRTRVWVETIARKIIISEVPQCQKLLQARAKQFCENNPDSPDVSYILFKPPAMATLSSQQLDGKAMDWRLTRSFSFSSTINTYKTVRVHNHILTGQPAVQSSIPKFGKISKEAAESSDSSDSESVKGAVSADGWRRHERKLKPEKVPPKVKKMLRAYDRDVFTKFGLNWSTRTLPQEMKTAAAAKSAARKSAAAKSVRLRCKTNRDGI